MMRYLWRVRLMMLNRGSPSSQRQSVGSRLRVPRVKLEVRIVYRQKALIKVLMLSLALHIYLQHTFFLKASLRMLQQIPYLLKHGTKLMESLCLQPQDILIKLTLIKLLQQQLHISRILQLDTLHTISILLRSLSVVITHLLNIDIQTPQTALLLLIPIIQEPLLESLVSIITPPLLPLLDQLT